VPRGFWLCGGGVAPMILADRFVFVHMPKTGGTFVTAVLDQLHRTKRRRILRAKVCRLLGLRARPGCRYGALENVEPKHGTCHDIPSAHQGKPILSCMRSPHDWYVSQYEFSWWKRTHLYDPNGPPTPAGYAIEQVLPKFAATRPHFPAISFAEFMELCHQASRVYDPSGKTGLYTHGFVRYFFKDPVAALPSFSEEYFSSGQARREMFDVHFLPTEILNQALENALIGFGYREKDVRFVRTLGRILPEGRGRRDDQPWQKYYTPVLERQVRENDWPLFAAFPRYAQPGS
jgi:hypothetical protein